MVKIIADTLACLPPEVVERYQIPVIPQVINFGEESFFEGQTIDNAGFMKRLVSSRELPKTAAPPPELFAEVFKQFASSNETILCIHPSAEVSGTVRSATIAAQDFPNLDIRVIDTLSIARPLGIMVEKAAAWAEAGESADVIVEKIHDLMERCRIYFVVDTLEYLARGGRIGGAAALLGSMLQIKPILTFQEGRVEQYDRERTHRRALARLKEIVMDQMPHSPEAHLVVLHAAAPQEALCLADDLRPLVGEAEIPIADVPPAIVTHGGPGILGVGFFIAKA